jgi:hypothetical protein
MMSSLFWTDLNKWFGNKWSIVIYETPCIFLEPAFTPDADLGKGNIIILRNI